MLSTAAPVTSIVKAAPAATKVAATKKTTSSGRWNRPKGRGRRTLDERITVATPPRPPPSGAPADASTTRGTADVRAHHAPRSHSRRAPGTDRSGSPQRWAAGAVVARGLLDVIWTGPSHRVGWLAAAWITRRDRKVSSGSDLDPRGSRDITA